MSEQLPAFKSRAVKCKVACIVLRFCVRKLHALMSSAVSIVPRALKILNGCFEAF